MTRPPSLLSTPSNEMAFAYHPLSAEADTRIIELQPAPDASHPLQCRIAELCLSSEDLIEYEALSYTWGQPDFSESLFVLQDDGQTSVLMITPNLKDALQRLRLPDRERRIWADAVCIDQHDDSDKSKQVPAMAQIYKSAVRVLVWLGWSSEGQRALVDIRKAMRFHSREDEKIKSHMSNLSRSFENLVKLPWFSRRWVIQEVVLAADVVMVCGLEELPFVQLLRMVTSLLRDVKTLEYSTQTALGPLAAISKLWGTWVFDSDQNKGLRLFDLLNLFHDSGCAVDHDRVFALCHLASDCLMISNELDEATAHDCYDIAVVIGYQQPVTNLYQSITEQMLGFQPAQYNDPLDLTRMMMMKKSVLGEVFDAVVERCNGHYRTDLPFWVPDWCLTRKRKALYKVLDFKREYNPIVLDGRFEHHPLFGVIIQKLVHHNPLELRGNEVTGLVTSVLEPFPEHPSISETTNWMQTMRIGFSKYGSHSIVAQPCFQETLRSYFRIEVDHLPTDDDTTYVHPDSAWSYFLSVLVRYMFHPSGTSPAFNGPQAYEQRDLYHLSLGRRIDFDSDSESWSYFSSVFRGRRLFSFKIDEDPEYSVSGVGIGPDHLAVGARFKIDGHEFRWAEAVHTLAWDSQAAQAPALVGDLWYLIFGQH